MEINFKSGIRLWDNVFQKTLFFWVTYQNRTLTHLIKDEEPLLQQDSLSYSQQLQFLKSPLFYCQILVFTMANCVLTLSINIVNDYMCESIEDHSMSIYEDIQSKFEFMRVTSP